MSEQAESSVDEEGTSSSYDDDDPEVASELNSQKEYESLSLSRAAIQTIQNINIIGESSEDNSLIMIEAADLVGLLPMN